MNLLELKILARRFNGTAQIDGNPHRREFSFKNRADMWFFIDSIENEIQAFRLFAIDHSNFKVYIRL